MPKPILGYICCSRLLNNNRPAQAVTEQYLMGTIPYIDAVPLMIPSIPNFLDIDAIAARLDGLLLTGSPSNIAPALYGDPDDDANGPFDEKRDNTSMAMCDAMLKLGKPVFGICRGFQELNVHFGGTIARDLSVEGRELKHHSPDGVSYDEMFAHGHEIEIMENSPLFEILGKEKTRVNSVHFQGVAKLGTGLEIMARAPDGVIESFYSKAKGGLVMAFQWHPEWDAPHNPDSQKIFAYIGDILRKSVI